MALAVPVIFVVFIIYPVMKIIGAGFFDGTSFTLAHATPLLEERGIRVLLNTARVSLLSTVGATILGIILAIGVVKGRWPGRRLFTFAAILHIISPPFIAAVVFIMLFGRRGFITHTLLGLDTSFIGWQAIVFLQILGNASIAFLVIASVLRRIDPNLEKSALDLGASRLRVFFTVTLPLMIPGILAAVVLVFANIIADFGTPILVGGGFRVLASEAYLQVLSLYNMPYASVLSILLALPCLLVLFMEKNILSDRNFYSTRLTQEEDAADQRPAFNLITLALVYVICIIYALLTLTQFSVIAIGAFTTTWGHDFSFSMRHIDIVLNQGAGSIKNSLTFAIQVALIGPFIGIVAAYYVSLKEGLYRRTLDFVAILPFAIPGPVIGISYVLAFHNPPLILTGTGLIIVLVCIIRELPISYNAGKAVFRQVAYNLEDASKDLGAGRFMTFFRVVFPLMTPAYKVGMLHAFIHTMTTIGAVIFLVTPKNKLLTFEIFSATNSGYLGLGAAFSFVLIILTLVGILVLSMLGEIPGFLKRFRKDVLVGSKRTKPEQEL